MFSVAIMQKQCINKCLKNMVVINVLKSCYTSQQCPVAICNKVQSKSTCKDVDYIIPLIGNTEGCNLEEEALL